MIGIFTRSVALAVSGAAAAVAVMSAPAGAGSPGAVTVTRITACVDAKTRAMFLAASDGTCPAGQTLINWPGRLDPALVTKLDVTLASSLMSARSLRSSVRSLASELAADQKTISRLEAKYTSETKASAKLHTLDEISQQTQKELQQASDANNALLLTISNILKKLADTVSSIVANLK